jgi:hypothetical protein
VCKVAKPVDKCSLGERHPVDDPEQVPDNAALLPCPQPPGCGQGRSETTCLFFRVSLSDQRMPDDQGEAATTSTSSETVGPRIHDGAMNLTNQPRDEIQAELRRPQS